MKTKTPSGVSYHVKARCWVAFAGHGGRFYNLGSYARRRDALDARKAFLAIVGGSRTGGTAVAGELRAAARLARRLARVAA